MHRLALLLSVLACVLLLAAFFAPTGAAGWLLALGCGLLPAALILLGAERRASPARRLRIGILLLFLIISGSLSALLILSSGDPQGGRVLARLLFQLGGLWLATLVVTGIVFPATFEAFWPDERTIEQSRSEHRESPTSR